MPQLLGLTKEFTPVEILKLVTYDNAQVLKLSGECNSYPRKLGEISSFIVMRIAAEPLH